MSIVWSAPREPAHELFLPATYKVVRITQRSARLLGRSFRLLRDELRTAKIGVRESEDEKLVWICVRSAEVSQEVVIVGRALVISSQSRFSTPLPLLLAISATLPYCNAIVAQSVGS